MCAERLRPAALLLALLLVPTGCIDALLEAPYVLTTGLGEAPRSLAPTADRALLVAGPAGVQQVDGSGQAHLVWTRPATHAVGHRRWTVVADAQALHLGPNPAPGQPFQPTRAVPVRDLRDLQAWCDDRVLLLVGQDLLLLGPQDEAPSPWVQGVPDARAVALGPGPGCTDALVLTGDALLRVGPEARTVLAQGLVAPRAVAVDRRGEAWVVVGEPAVLARVRDGQAETIARHLGQVVDLHFGTGELLHPDNAYLLTAEGTVDYVRVPAPPEAP